MTPILHTLVKRRWLMAFLVLVLVLTSIVVFERALADPPTLKPPFKIIRENARPFGLNGPELVPLNGTIIFSQTFNSTYHPTTTLSAKGWHELTAVPDQYTWARITGAPLTDTVWSAARYTFPNPPFDPVSDTYTNGMEAMLIYGPVDLSDYFQVVLTTTFWIDTNTKLGADGLPEDFLGLAYSTDGSTWIEPYIYIQSSSDPTLSNPHSTMLKLKELAGKPTVWIAFIFTSNDDNLNGRGAFIQDVVVRGTPYARLYLPLTRRDATPTPTATPTATPAPSYRYFYTFTDQSSTNNPDFNRWGGDKSTSCGSNCTFYQALAKNLGNPGNAFKIWIDGVNGKGGAGPRNNGVSLVTATNFEYSADVYLYNGQKKARYGLVFDANSTALPDSGSPPFEADDSGSNYYTLELRVNDYDRTQVTQWQFVKVVAGVRKGVVALTTLPYSLVQGQWHNIKVRQSGAELQFYLDGQRVATQAYDTAWGDGRRRFGLYIQTDTSNGDGGPMEFFADNIAVKDLP